jgi:hypothetical protein
LLGGGGEDGLDAVDGGENQLSFVVCCVVEEWLWGLVWARDWVVWIAYAGDVNNCVDAINNGVEDSNLGEVFDDDEIKL